MALAAAEDGLMAELLAYGIAGHHAGLPDRRGGEGALEARLKKPLPDLAPVWSQQIGPLPARLAPTALAMHPQQSRRPFQLAMLARFLFSCLVDADFRDTEAFYARAENREVEREIHVSLEALAGKLDRHLTGLRRSDSEVNRLRGTVLDHVRERAALVPGLFSLTVPTGGGKTLASLAFALDHARRYGLDRVIYAIPFTSVIDQTASVFRDILGEAAVLEHHSAIDEERTAGREAADKLKLAMEDWAAPVVVTTNVQLFESLFSNRPSRCRKLHNLARSVIVLDEAQTIPLHVLRPCVAAIDELARNYGTSIVLCTATQPALMAPEFEGGFENVRELAPDPPGLQRRLARVTFRQAGDMADAELVAALVERPQGLVIVNSRAHALSLYREARQAGLEGAVHLTTRMVAAHRREVLARIRTALAAGGTCRVIATSLVEAGVDLDFPAVFRAETGLDSVLQAAGRCNREGRRPRDASVVTVFHAPDWPAPREIRAFAADMRRIGERHPDLGTLAAIRDYFAEVYWRKGPEALDAAGVMAAFRADRTGTDFAFRSVAESFRMIEEGMAPVIVPRDAPSRAAVDALPHAERTGGLARRLQPYVVQVPPRARQALLEFGRVRFVDAAMQFAVLTDESLYGEDTGLVWEAAEDLAPGASVY